MSTASYRESHQAAGHGAHYDEVNYGPGRYDAQVWRLERRILDKMLDRYFPAGVERCLDFACGTGRVTGALAARARRVVGLDVSEDMLKTAREKVSGALFLRGDLTRERTILDREAPFDLITGFRFLLNAEPELRQAAVGALVPLLAKGGLLIVNNHGNRSSLLGGLGRLKAATGGNRENTLPGREVVRLLRAHELEVLHVVGVCFLPPALGRRLPFRCWMPLERALEQVTPIAGVAVNQLFVARKRVAEEGSETR